MIEEKLYTPQEIRDLLKKKEIRTVYRYIKNDKLKATRIQNRFYIKEKDLREFMQLPAEEK